MSEVTPTVEQPLGSAKPFESQTTPNIERANRLISLRQHPGFLDLIRLSMDGVDSATAACLDYPGWDKDMIVVLKVRAQAAKEHHIMWLAKISNAIKAGQDEQKELIQAAVVAAELAGKKYEEKSPQEILEQGDYVRQAVLEEFAKKEEEQRAAGSYGPDDDSPYKTMSDSL